MGLARHGASPRVSDNCFAMTSRVQCSKCDADIATGNNPENMFCLAFCDQWYISCIEDYMDPYLDPNEQVPFCKEDSMVCSKVSDIASSSRAFCEYMGHKVMSPEEME